MTDSLMTDKLVTIAATRVLLVASDYDGVLAPIVSDPAAAIPDQEALSALVSLGQMADTHAVAISGRSRATLLSLTDNPDGVAMIGTHGAEMGDVAVPESTGAVRRLQADLLSLSGHYPGSEVEVKPIGAAFHYRNAAHGERAATEAQAIARAAGARVIAGKKVVECVFGDADKGSALTAMRHAVAATGVVFVGDDITDEDAFAVLGEQDLGIKVGPGPTLATSRVSSQQDVAEVLETLAIVRSGLQT